MKFNARAFTSITFDFDIEAKDEHEAESKVKKYLKYVQYGKLETQKISIDVDADDTLRSCFVMEIEVEDVYEQDE